MPTSKYYLVLMLIVYHNMVSMCLPAGGFSSDFTSVKQAGFAGVSSCINADAAILFSNPAAMGLTQKGFVVGSHLMLPRTTFVEEGTHLSFDMENGR